MNKPANQIALGELADFLNGLEIVDMDGNEYRIEDIVVEPIKRGKPTITVGSQRQGSVLRQAPPERTRRARNSESPTIPAIDNSLDQELMTPIKDLSKIPDVTHIE